MTGGAEVFDLAQRLLHVHRQASENVLGREGRGGCAQGAIKLVTANGRGGRSGKHSR